jgi:hypothetical protein
MTEQIFHITWGRADFNPSGPGGAWLAECLCGWTQIGTFARTNEKARSTAERLAEAFGKEHVKDPGDEGRPVEMDPDDDQDSVNCVICGDAFLASRLHQHVQEKHTEGGRTPRCDRLNCGHPSVCNDEGGCRFNAATRPTDRAKPVFGSPFGPGAWGGLQHPMSIPIPPPLEHCPVCQELVSPWNLPTHLAAAHPVKDTDL